MKKLIMSSILGLAVLGLAIPQQANALGTISLSDGVNTVVVTDGGAGDTDGAVNGVVSYNGSLGGATVWTVNVTTGITYPVLGSQTVPHMDLNSVNVSSSAGGNLTIMFSEVNYGGGGGVASAVIGGTASGLVQYSTYADASNTLFGMGINMTNSPNLGPGGFTDTTAGGFAVGGPYSLTQVVTVSHGDGGDSSSFNAELTVPEPASLMLLGSGLLGLAAWRRKVSGSSKA